jgi:hypothetical protein
MRNTGGLNDTDTSDLAIVNFLFNSNLKKVKDALNKMCSRDLLSFMVFTIDYILSLIFIILDNCLYFRKTIENGFTRRRRSELLEY